jgi:hypothetical protein
MDEFGHGKLLLPIIVAYFVLWISGKSVEKIARIAKLLVMAVIEKTKPLKHGGTEGAEEFTADFHGSTRTKTIARMKASLCWFVHISVIYAISWQGFFDPCTSA